MPQPDISNVHIDGALTSISVKYRYTNDAFIADKVFPVVPVQHRSDAFHKYNREQWYRSDAQKRAPATQSAGTGYTLTEDNYRVDVYAVHKDIDDQTRANADSQIALDSDATELVTRQLLIKKEEDWVTSYFTTGVWANDVTPANLWSDYATSDPIGDLETAMMTMAENTGYKPNTLVLSPNVWSKLKNHPDYLARIAVTQPRINSPELITSLVDGLDNVYIPWAIKNTAVEPLTGVYDFFYAGDALLLYVEPSLGLNGISAGATFSWTAFMGDGIRIKRFRMEEIESERIEGQMAYDHKVIASDLGYFFNNVVA